jgi:peroxiredoxin
MRRSALVFSLALLAGLGATRAWAFALSPTVLDGKQTPPKKPGEQKPKPPEKKPEPAKPAEKPAEAKKLAVGGEVDATLSLMDTQGKAQTLKDYRGKVTVIEFWSMDASSAAWDKKMAALAADFGKKGVAFLLVDPVKADVDSGDQPFKRLSEHAQKSGLTAPIAIDKATSWAEHLGATTTGEVFVIDAKGVLKYRGAIDDDAKGEKGDKATPHLANALTAVLAGKDPSPSTTVAAGAPIHLDAKPAEASGKTPPKK